MLGVARRREAWGGWPVDRPGVVGGGGCVSLGAWRALGNYAFFTDPMILEFVLGVIAGHLFVHGRIDRAMLIATCCAFAAVLAGDPFNRAIVAGIPAACLVTAAAFVSRKRIHPSWPE